jgi:hypothetical protein
VQKTFKWTTFDVTSSLPPGWQREISSVAADADFRDFPRTPALSREGPDVAHIARGRVHANQVKDRLPWLYAAYRGHFLALAGQRTTRAPAGGIRRGPGLFPALRSSIDQSTGPYQSYQFLQPYQLKVLVKVTHDPADRN